MSNLISILVFFILLFSNNKNSSGFKQHNRLTIVSINYSKFFHLPIKNQQTTITKKLYRLRSKQHRSSFSLLTPPFHLFHHYPPSSSPHSPLILVYTTNHLVLPLTTTIHPNPPTTTTHKRLCRLRSKQHRSRISLLSAQFRKV